MEQPPKAYFMCSSTGLRGWKIFVLNLSTSSSGSAERCPTVRLDGKVFSTWNFCIVGSTLYGFEGVEIMTDSGGKMIYKFELPSDDQANIDLEKHMFAPVCEMKDRKFFPGAVACPSGKKVIVYSGFKKKTSFELFDPVGGFCSRLRSLPTVPGCNARLHSRCFISDTEFVLGMDQGIFKIDIGHRDPKWKKLKNFYGGVLPSTYYKVIGNDLCVTATCAYSIVGLDCRTARCETGEKKAYNAMCRWIYFYPDASAIQPRPGSYANASIIVLSGGGGESDVCEFCVLKAGEISDAEEVTVTLDVYQCSLSGCRIELVRNSEMEEVVAQEKMEKLQKWREEFPEGGYGDPVKRLEDFRMRGSLMGKELRPLPCTRLKMSSRFTFKATEVFLRDFSTIPTGV